MTGNATREDGCIWGEVGGESDELNRHLCEANLATRELRSLSEPVYVEKKLRVHRILFNYIRSIDDCLPPGKSGRVGVVTQAAN